jgi:hypothetical protein
MPGPAQATTPAPSSDPAEQILRSAQGVDSNAQAAAWDAFHQSQNEDELTQRLQNINIPQDVKANLWDAKRSHAAPKQSQPGAPLTESEAANSNYATNQSKTAVPMETSTLGSVYHSLNEGNETSADPRGHAAAEYGKRVQAGLDAANRGEITASGVGLGAFKGGVETAHTVGALGSKAINAVRPGTVPDVSFEEPKNLEAANTSEKIGKVGENVFEFLVGDEALKGLSLAEKAKHLAGVAKVLETSPKAAKALEIGANALRQGTVGGTQTLAHGGTLEDAATTGLVTGGVGAALEGAGVGIKALKNFVTRNPQVEQMGRELVSGLTEGATPEQVARTVGKNVADAEEKMRSTYDAGFKKISAQGQSVPVSIAGSPLQQTATDLLSDSKIPGTVAESLKGVIPDAEKIEPFLKQMSESKEVFSWDQMEATRQKIGETIRKLPWDSPIRPDLIKVRYAIDDTFEKAAEKAGNADLSDQIKSLRGQYAQTNGLLEERAIETQRDKNPNARADVLRGKESVHDVNTLRRLIGPDNMKVVEGSMLDSMIQKASKNGELQGRQLLRDFNKLGPDAKQAIWGERLPQIEQFMKQAGSLPNVVLDKIVNHYAPYALGTAAIYKLGSGDVKGAATVAGAAGLAALLRNPIVLEAALKGIGVLQKAAPPAVSAIMQNQSEGDNSNPTSENWTRVQFADGSVHQIHPEDVEQALKQNPGAKVQEQ